MEIVLEKLQAVLNREYSWIKRLINHKEQESKRRILTPFNWSSIEDLDSTSQDVYTQVAVEQQWTKYDRLLVLLALAPFIDNSIVQDLFSIYDSKNQSILSQKNNYLELKHAFFLMERTKGGQPVNWIQFLEDDYLLYRERVLDKPTKDEAQSAYDTFSQVLKTTEEFRRQIAHDKLYEPDFSPSFPARKVTTEFGWEDLILDNKVAGLVQNMASWVKNLEHLKTYPSLKKGLKGYSAILYGPPGTGKSMTVKVLGKELGKTVYRIDLSQVVSKYVGETEKNLGRIFDLARDKDWILFFDEGDALFGKRSSSKSSQDRYANQEVAYLLQRMEEHEGVILLATNKMGNIDDAFLRRFQTQIYFPKPDEGLRLILWKDAYAHEFKLEQPEILNGIASKYEVTPAQIINVKHHSIVKTIASGKKEVAEESLLEGLSLELQKSNKTL